ncbi:hypothetical protein AVEN_27478-1 [Araneus ventricosus]|uniref:Uncharacterized protein n=1 Tax=Araneus ventricosus TaxID=182803 RepID=A0A4Y2SW67_ARAVE|nr:hypothetical protein AVEN_27478-1 [Araneus ventricosus]
MTTGVKKTYHSADATYPCYATGHVNATSVCLYHFLKPNAIRARKNATHRDPFTQAKPLMMLGGGRKNHIVTRALFTLTTPLPGDFESRSNKEDGNLLDSLSYDTSGSTFDYDRFDMVGFGWNQIEE